MYLHEDTRQFRATVLSCADAFGIAPDFVAKDYYIVLLLSEITRVNPDVVFKGGTSLSKCHHAIDRFSEDVDLGLSAERPTEGMRKGMKLCVVAAAEAVGLKIENLDQTRSKREYNKFIIALPDLGDTPLEPLIVETAVMTPAAPSKPMPIEMFLHEWAQAEGLASELARFEDTTPFELLVNSVGRTFCDKAFALCDYHLAEEPIPARQSRHIYDLRKLQGLISFDDELARLFATVRRQRRGKNRCPSAEPGVDFAAVLRELADNDVYKGDYVGITMDLLYDKIPYEEAVKALRDVADFVADIDWDDRTEERQRDC